MSRTLLNFVVDVVSGLAMLGLILTGLIMRFALPPGSGRQALWNLGRHDWGGIHFWLAAAVVVLVIVHVALHWTWVCGFIRRCVTRNPQATSPRDSIYGVAVILLLAAGLGGFAWLATAGVKPGEGRHRQEQGRGEGTDAAESIAPDARTAEDHGQPSGNRPVINGSITILQAAALAGCTPQRAKQRLGLPPDTPDSMRLREVADSKGLGMPELRDRLTR